MSRLAKELGDIRPQLLEGERYGAVVPDTLDLAERAKLAINAITGGYDPVTREIFDSRVFFSKPPYMTHIPPGRLSGLQTKFAEALPMLRVMSGSLQNSEVDLDMMKMVSSLIDDTGIFYVPGTTPDRPWHGPAIDYAQTYHMARMFRALLVWYRYDGNPVWKALLDSMVKGMDRMAVHKEDYAYYPGMGGLSTEGYLGTSYTRSGWKSTEEPGGERESAEESSVLMQQGYFPGVLALWYDMSGNEDALLLANKLLKFIMKPKFWGIKAEPSGMVGLEHAHWDGHWHGHLETLRGLLEYAIITNDSALKQFVRDGYEWARNYGIPRMGWFLDYPGHPDLTANPKSVGPFQGCGPARIIVLAIKLSDAGIGDYWEDVDQYIRNQGTEGQILRADLLEKISAAAGEVLRPNIMERLFGETPVQGIREWDRWETGDRVIERSVGDWGAMCWPTIMLKTKELNSFTHGCCTSHGSMGLYYAWEATVRCKDGLATVNLLLNRASPWLDIDSYLPYEGKVVVRNKNAKRVHLRIPLWVNKNAVRTTIAGTDASPVWLGNYVVLEGLSENEDITVEFPLVESTERHRLGDKEYTCSFRGNTLVDIDPRDEELGYPIYLRDHYKQDKAPMKKVERFVSSTTINLSR